MTQTMEKKKRKRGTGEEGERGIGIVMGRKVPINISRSTVRGPTRKAQCQGRQVLGRGVGAGGGEEERKNHGGRIDSSVC